MSKEYYDYLTEHKKNVAAAYQWLCDNLPDLIPLEAKVEISTHDESKNRPDEYFAYDEYFYGGNRSFEVVNEFNKAWLKHIHRNPHHWQHWVLIEDDPKRDEMPICIEMPYKYVIEMICDWWSFSFAKGNLNEIFSWYDSHKKNMLLNDETRKVVENILSRIRGKLEETEEF